MLGFYRKLLWLYPADHREQFAEEMIAVLRDVRAEEANQKLFACVKLYVREAAGLIRGALREHMRILLDAHVGLSLSNGRFSMRNGFRFPKSTAILMTIILAGVVVAIRKGEVIATSLPPFSQPITPIHPAHSYLLPGVVEGIIFFYAAGLAGWAVVFALRKSGVHRLDQIAGEK